MFRIKWEVAHLDTPTISNIRNKDVSEEICVFVNTLKESWEDIQNETDGKLDVEKVIDNEKRLW